MSNASCVLVAGRHPALAEGIRGLLETVFAVVVMVADGRSLVAAAGGLGAPLAVVDVAIAEGRMGQLVAELRGQCPGIKVIALSVDEQPTLVASMLRAGVDRFIPLRSIATDLVAAAEELISESPVALPPTVRGVEE